VFVFRTGAERGSIEHQAHFRAPHRFSLGVNHPPDQTDLSAFGVSYRQGQPQDQGH
jgi:hypothetical protein